MRIIIILNEFNRIRIRIRKATALVKIAANITITILVLIALIRIISIWKMANSIGTEIIIELENIAIDIIFGMIIVRWSDSIVCCYFPHF